MEYRLRPAQEEILHYEQGLMAVSAVPGSGKTFTLSLLAARLIAAGRVDVAQGQQVLIVTYLNASVDTFKARVRQHLLEMDLPLLGFDVRTLHSLALEVVRLASGGVDAEDELTVLDEIQSDTFLNHAVTGWIDAHPAEWRAFLPAEAGLPLRTRWRTITEQTARAFIRAAKNHRYRPEQIRNRLQRLAQQLPTVAELEDQSGLPTEGAFGEIPDLSLLSMLAGIYERYQAILFRQGALDFDDLIWEAADLLERRPDVGEMLRRRWPYVLEDEAQDSVPLQEALLGALAGPEGNWVRVGDPNQAITSSFTAAHPAYFTAFMERSDVTMRPLPNSGRSALSIIEAANTLMHWVLDHHPVPEVGASAFRRQQILPTPPGDAQPNPPDTESNIRIKVYEQREDEELPSVARLAVRYARARPGDTLAILVPTNRTGYQLADHLDALDADYDNLLRGGTREREIAAAMYSLLSLMSAPLDTRALIAAHEALVALEHPAAGPLVADGSGGEATGGTATPQAGDLDHFYTLLRSVYQPERLLFPDEEDDGMAALPAGVSTEADRARLQPFLAFLRGIFHLRPLPIDDLVLALGDELFAPLPGTQGLEKAPETAPARTNEQDLAIAYQIAVTLGRWRDLEPDSRLPTLAERLGDIASGRRSLPAAGPGDVGYEPQPGRITLVTQHGAKGLEWDAVFLVGIDNFWIPGDLDAPFLGVHDFLGGHDPAAEAIAQLHYLMGDHTGLHPGRSATESAHIELIAERLRLLYVGITRARRYLHISRSRSVRRYGQARPAAPANVLGVLYRFLQGR
ncbi:MAG: ATP-dependent helicase [Candidatus Promineifilaceae bacterium]|nr:ATP-dependent helicase [Candidatus Promineifilaceae bacterium]